MLFFGQLGYRVVAHDRRGNRRSDQPSNGNDMDTYADDLAALLKRLDLQNVIVMDHSTGGGEVVRYIARHGSKRVSKVVLIGAVPPIMLQSATNPGGLPMEVFEVSAKASKKIVHSFTRTSHFLFRFNREGAPISEGLRESFWLQGMTGSVKSQFDTVKAFLRPTLPRIAKKSMSLLLS